MAEVSQLRTVACERCSRRKQKCGRELPVCSQCFQSSVDCRDGRGERVMTRTDVGLIQPKSPIEILEDRLEQLRRQASEHEDGPAISAHQNAPIEQPTSTVRQPTSQNANESRNPSAGSTEIQSRRHSPEISLLSLSAMAEPNCRAAEFLKGISMPGIISAITESYGGNPQSTSRIDALWDGIAKDIRQSSSKVPGRLYLPKEDALDYVKTYYHVVDYRYPHLPEQSVNLGITAITEAKEADYDTMLSQDPAKVFMAYMVLAITPLVSDAYPVAQASFISIHILSKALKILDKVFQLEDGVDIIYCLILLVIFSLHSSAAGSTWHLAGVAMKKCIALGFHRQVTKARLPSEEDLEQRRWAFWLCYFLDRLISCALDRPFSINDRDITIELPGTRAPFVATSSSQCRHLHLYRYSLLLSKVVDNKGASPLSYHLNHLLHWETSAPVTSEPFPVELEEHSNSLLNTLALRAMTDQIITPSIKSTTNHATPISRDASASSYAPSTNGNYEPIQVGELMECAQAVIRSLNRRSMQRRSTLSWITGYTSIRASVALLYCLARSKSNRALCILSDANVRDCEEHVDIGMEVMSVVSRQFPIMQEYRSLISSLKLSINEVFYDPGSRMRRVEQLMEAAVKIGPNNIFLLTKKTIELVERG